MHHTNSIDDFVNDINRLMWQTRYDGDIVEDMIKQGLNRELGVTVAVFQGTRVSPSNANGTGAERERERERERKRKRERERERERQRTFPTGMGTGTGTGTDNIGQTCRQRRTALDEHRRMEESKETEETDSR